MERTAKLLLCSLLLAPAVAIANTGQKPMGSVGVYATNTDVDFAGFSDDDIGFGVKGWLGFGVPFAHFEYQTTTIGNAPNEVDVENLRLGGGAAFKVSEPMMAFGKAEYVDLGSDLDEDGFGIHGGAIFIPGPAMHVFGSVGYLSLNDTDGIELNAGAAFNFTKQFGVFVDYRKYLGSIDNPPPGVDDSFDLSDARAGAMFSWGM